jgi:hypothetical protein
VSIQRAVVSFLQGSYWLRYQQVSTRISPEHTVSYNRLVAYVESQVGDSNILYNFDEDLLPDEEIQSSIAPAPSRAVKLETLFAVRAPRVMLAEQMAIRKEQGLSTEGVAMSPRVTLTCAFKECGKEFERRESLLVYKQTKGGSRNNPTYCSKQCSSRGAQRDKPASIELECEQCKQKFLRPRRNISKGGKISFCCRACQSQYYREHPAGGKN